MLVLDRLGREIAFPNWIGPHSLTPKRPTIANVSTLQRRRLITVVFALFSLLFMQLAVAGYVCPMEGKAAEIATMAEAGMPCAGDMVQDTEQPGLCHAHCQSSEQSVEKVQSPAPSAAVATGFTYTVQPVRLVIPSYPRQGSQLQRTTSPPLQVRNCCFRI